MSVHLTQLGFRAGDSGNHGEGGAIQYGFGSANSPVMDAFQGLDESPKPNTYIKSNEGAGKGQANKEEISKDAQMENENPQTHMLADTEDEDAGEMSNYSAAQECLDRLAISLGGTTIVPVSSELLPAYLAALERQKHHAALIRLAQIAEGCSKAHAASAVLNFIGNCTPEILTPYLDGIVSKLLVLLQNGKQMVQEGVTEMKVAVEIFAAVVRLMFDPGGEFSAIAAKSLKLEVKLL